MANISIKKAVEDAMIALYTGTPSLRRIDDLTVAIGEKNALVSCGDILPSGKPNCYFCDVDFITGVESHKDKDQVKIDAVEADVGAFVRGLTKASIATKISGVTCDGVFCETKCESGSTYSELKDFLNVRTWTRTIAIKA